MSVLRAAGECSLCKGDGEAAGRARSIGKGLGKLCGVGMGVKGWADSLGS